MEKFRMGMQTNGIEETSFAPAGCRSGNLRKSGTENLYDATEFYEHRRGLQPIWKNWSGFRKSLHLTQYTEKNSAVPA